MAGDGRNYFSMEYILATQERMTCTILKPMPKLGFLIPGNTSEDIHQGTVMELPFWMVQGLQKSKLAKMQLPKILNEKNRNIFEADAKVVNLFRINPYFYEFGRALVQINFRENEIIQQLITKAFKDRFRLIMDWADNVMTEPKKIQCLDLTERSLLKSGQKARMQLDLWLTEGFFQLQPAELVQNLRKRKLLTENE